MIIVIICLGRNNNSPTPGSPQSFLKTSVVVVFYYYFFLLSPAVRNYIYYTIPLWTSTLGGTAFFSPHVPLAFVGVDVVTGGGCCCCCCCWSRFASAPSGPGNDGDAAPVGVGVIGLPSLISSTIWSASFDKSPSGLKGLSHPSELKQRHRRPVTSHFRIFTRANTPRTRRAGG